ncbi:MAG: hypothetical protein K8S55_13365, partial [Phycisphaerae bacterium]|nr:hypothetical protein [Phycisphaerae bacterium]
MNPIKLIRKLGKALRGGATFRDMFLGIFLGFAIGMIPGVNLTLILLIILLLFLNTNGALASLAFLLGKALCLVLAPFTFHIGYMMIHDIGMIGLVRSAADTPVVALLDLHIYCLFGALPLIIVIGGLLAWFVPKSIIKARAAAAAVTGGSEKAQKVASSKLVRFLMRVAFGKQKETMAEMADKKSPLIRKGRVVAAMVILAAIIVVQMIYLDSLVKHSLETSLGLVNGAEVNIDNTDLSLSNGRLVIKGIMVTDAAKPTHNLAKAERFVTDVSIADLLKRRFVVDRLECEALQMDNQRETPGEVYRKPVEEKKPSAALGDMVKKHLGKSAEYYEEIKKFNERLEKLQEYLKSNDPGDQPDTAKPDKDALARKAKALGYLKLSAQDYLAKSPTWVIRELKISRITLRPGLPTFIVEGKNLSSHPSLYPEKPELTANPDDEALKNAIANPLKAEGIKGKLLDVLPGGKKDQKSKDDQKKK